MNISTCTANSYHSSERLEYKSFEETKSDQPFFAWRGKSKEELVQSLNTLPEMPVILSNGKLLLSPARFYLLLTHSRFLQTMFYEVNGCENEIAACQDDDFISLDLFSEKQLFAALEILEQKKITRENVDGAELLDFLYCDCPDMKVDSLNQQVRLPLSLAFHPSNSFSASALSFFSCGISRNIETAKIIRKIACFPYIKELKFEAYDSLRDGSFISQFHYLEHLSLAWTSSIQDLSFLPSLRMLKTLNLCNCSAIRRFEELQTLSSLEALSLSACGISNLSDLQTLTNLKILNLGRCYQLTDIESVSHLTNLEELNLSSCTKVQNSSPLGTLVKVERLNLSQTKIRSLTDIHPISSLRSLNLSGCERILEFSLSHFSNLTFLNLSQTEISDLSSISGLASLQYLSLWQCRHVQSLLSLSNLANLQQLDISYSNLARDSAELASRLPNLQIVGASRINR